MSAARPVLATLLVLALAPAALAMGERPQGTPGEQTQTGAMAAIAMAKRGELEPALASLLKLAEPTLAAYPVDAQAAVAIANAQRQCVHEASRHSEKGRWLNIALRAHTHAIETYRRLAASLVRQAREPNGRRSGPDAWFTVTLEVLEAGIDQFPDIPPQDPSYSFNQTQAETDRSLPRDRYRKEVVPLFKALRNNIQTNEEATEFKKAYRRAVDAARASNATTLRLNELILELDGWGLTVPAPRS